MGCFSGAVAHVLWGQRHWLPPPPTTKTISPGVIPNSVLEFHSGTPWMKRFWKNSQACPLYMFDSSSARNLSTFEAAIGLRWRSNNYLAWAIIVRLVLKVAHTRGEVARYFATFETCVIQRKPGKWNLWKFRKSQQTPRNARAKGTSATTRHEMMQITKQKWRKEGIGRNEGMKGRKEGTEEGMKDGRIGCGRLLCCRVFAAIWVIRTTTDKTSATCFFSGNQRMHWMEFAKRHRSIVVASLACRCERKQCQRVDG